MKKIIRKILIEDRQEHFLNKIILLMKDEYPVYKKLEDYGFYDDLSEEELVYVLSGVFGEPIIKRDKTIYNQNRDILYSENSYGFWKKYEYYENGNIKYFERSDGFWEKREYDENGKDVYYENSDGNWVKKEYDDNGKRIYFERSDGYIVDNRR